MKSTGYTISHRSKWKHHAFNNLLEAAIWQWMIDSAAWKDCTINFNGQIVNLKRGQFITSVKFIADGFQLTSQVTRTFLKKLEKQQMVQQATNNRGTIITICNYCKYQDEKSYLTINQQTDNKQLTNSQQTDNNNKKEIKEIKEVKKYNINKPENVSVEVWDDFRSHRKIKKANITKTALARIEMEAAKINWTLEQALIEICMRGWTGFKADWVKNSTTNQKGINNGKQQYTANDALEDAINEIEREEEAGDAFCSPVLLGDG